MLHAVVLTQYRRVTDRRTERQMDRIAVASTALAMWALWRAVKINYSKLNSNWNNAFYMQFGIKAEKFNMEVQQV